MNLQLPKVSERQKMEHCSTTKQQGLAVASTAPDVVVEMTPPRDDNAW